MKQNLMAKDCQTTAMSQIWPVTCSSKVLLSCSHFFIIYGNFYIIMVASGREEKDYLDHKAENIHLDFYKSMLTYNFVATSSDLVEHRL